MALMPLIRRRECDLSTRCFAATLTTLTQSTTPVKELAFLAEDMIIHFDPLFH